MDGDGIFCGLFVLHFCVAQHHSTNMMTFSTADGDAWFQRNRAALATAAEHDWPLKLAEKHSLVAQETDVLEVGCANGWRLLELIRLWGCYGTGIDISQSAIDSAPSNPNLFLDCLSIHDMHEYNKPLVICYFVLHWVNRKALLRSLMAIDRAIMPCGHLIIGDFLPDAPTKVPYHHHEGLWTYKANYALPFKALGLYEEIETVVFDHDDPKHAVGDYFAIPAHRRAFCTLLRKL